MPAASTPTPGPFLPDLAGVATKDLVETIGTGKYSAQYINWSRTLELLRKHAPGWMAETIRTPEGELVHRAPVGGYLLIRFRHLDGTTTPEVPQAVMDHRNAAIPFDKITARDITDTHRRGVCLAAAFTFGLAHELWAKQPLESGYASGIEELPDTPRVTTTAPAAAKAPEVTKEQFLEAAIAKGLTTHSAEDLLSKIGQNYAGGIKRLDEKDQAWVDAYNKTTDPKNNAGQF